ncbi:hypothetical protein ACJJTC_007589 [Scirpophaga incertulas]
MTLVCSGKSKRILGTPNRRRKQRQAEDLLKLNVCVCIPIVGFLYAAVGAQRRCGRATGVVCALVPALLLCAVHSRASHRLAARPALTETLDKQNNEQCNANRGCIK